MDQISTLSSIDSEPLSHLQLSSPFLHGFNSFAFQWDFFIYPFSYPDALQCMNIDMPIDLFYHQGNGTGLADFLVGQAL